MVVLSPWRESGTMMPETKVQPVAPVLLIYAPVPVYLFQGDYFVERQAINGLRLWARHFHHVIVMMPVEEKAPPAGWLPASKSMKNMDRVHIEPLPMAYRPDKFLWHFLATRKRIRSLIEQADCLSFAIGGLFGDWGAVAAVEAQRLGRPFAVWTDRVESEVTRSGMHEGSWRKRLRARLTHRLMARLERSLIHMAPLGLFHGKETFEAYKGYSQNPQLVHDIHLRAEDHIPLDVMRNKVRQAREGPLRIVYAGRADAMKGPIDWIAVLERLHVMGVDFRATWMGDGDELLQMRARVSRSGLRDRVFLPGFVSDRVQVLQELRRAHVFMFCHNTPESPRCLIESLCNGTPIVGYDGAFAADLIAQHAGGTLVAQGDIESLAFEVAALATDRARLGRLIGQARSDAVPFTDEKVFEHRSQLIKKYLAPQFEADEVRENASVPYQESQAARVLAWRSA